jgi:hypothetical protein
MGGRSGIARGLSSAGASGFFGSPCAAGAGAFASGSAAATGGRVGGAMGTPRFGGSIGPGSAEVRLGFVSAGAVVSAGFGTFAASRTDVSPPK